MLDRRYSKPSPVRRAQSLRRLPPQVDYDLTLGRAGISVALPADSHSGAGNFSISIDYPRLRSLRLLHPAIGIDAEGESFHERVLHRHRRAVHLFRLASIRRS